MLRAANSGESSIPPLIETPASPTLSSNGKGKEKELEMEEPDDGFAVGGEKKGSTQELKKISEVSYINSLISSFARFQKRADDHTLESLGYLPSVQTG